MFDLTGCKIQELQKAGIHGLRVGARNDSHGAAMTVMGCNDEKKLSCRTRGACPGLRSGGIHAFELLSFLQLSSNAIRRRKAVLMQKTVATQGRPEHG